MWCVERRCSPSQTISMPARSWSSSASTVASSCASASAPPESRQFSRDAVPVVDQPAGPGHAADDGGRYEREGDGRTPLAGIWKRERITPLPAAQRHFHCAPEVNRPCCRQRTVRSTAHRPCLGGPVPCYVHENPHQTRTPRRRWPDRRGRPPAHERQGGHGLRRPLRGGNALRQGIQGSQQAQLPPERRLQGRPQGKKQPPGARHGKRLALWTKSAGGIVAKHRGRCLVPPRRGRRARAHALQLPGRGAADGTGDRRRRQPGPQVERRGIHGGSGTRAPPDIDDAGRAHAVRRESFMAIYPRTTCWSAARARS